MRQPQRPRTVETHSLGDALEALVRSKRATTRQIADLYNSKFGGKPPRHPGNEVLFEQKPMQPKDLHQMYSKGGPNAEVLSILDDNFAGWRDLRAGGNKKDGSAGNTIREQSFLTGRQKGTNINADVSLLAPKNSVPAHQGGSARPFAMSSDRVEEVVVPFALGEEFIVVVVSDGTLKPEIRTGTVLVFERTTTPVEGPHLIVESDEEPGTYAIRRYDPDGDDGHGTFVDKRGVLAPLSRTEWRVAGVLAAMTARGGLVV